MPQQIRAITRKRLLAPIGALENGDLRVEIESRVLEHLDIAFEADEEV